jgi:LPS sulfotransferase NodH
MPRSGSTLLSTSLNTHSQIRCGNELLSKKNCNDNPKTILLKFCNETKKPIVGFKIHHSNCWDENEQYKNIWNLLAINDISIIFITRELLESYISLIIAAKTGKWRQLKSDQPQLQTEKINFNQTEYIDYCNRTTNGIRRMFNLFKYNNHIHITYDELLNGTTYQKILTFLNVPQQELQTALAKQEHRKLSEIIINYDEAIKCRDEWYLQSPFKII